MKIGKMKAKDAAHKVAAVVTPNGVDGDDQTWKRETLQGRSKKANVDEGVNEKTPAVKLVVGQTEPTDYKHQIIKERDTDVGLAAEN